MRKTLRVRMELLDDGEPVAVAQKDCAFEGDADDCFSADGVAEPLGYVLAAMNSLGVMPPVEWTIAHLIDKVVEWEGASADWQPVADAAGNYLAVVAERIAELKKGQK